MSGAQDKMSRHIYVDHRGLCSSAPNALNFPVQGGGEGVCFAKDKMTRHIYVWIIEVCTRMHRILRCRGGQDGPIM